MARELSRDALADELAGADLQTDVTEFPEVMTGVRRSGEVRMRRKMMWRMMMVALIANPAEIVGRLRMVMMRMRKGGSASGCVDNATAAAAARVWRHGRRNEVAPDRRRRRISTVRRMMHVVRRRMRMMMMVMRR